MNNCEICGFEIPEEDERIKSGSYPSPTRYYHELCLKEELELNDEADKRASIVKYWKDKDYKLGVSHQAEGR